MINHSNLLLLVVVVMWFPVDGSPAPFIRQHEDTSTSLALHDALTLTLVLDPKPALGQIA